MAAVSLFWNTNMAAVTSCENAPFTSVSVGPSPRSYSFTPAMVRVLGCTVPKCGTEPIRYVTIHIQDRRGAALFLNRNRAEISVIICEALFGLLFVSA